MEDWIKLVYKLWSKIYDRILDKIFHYDRKEAVSLFNLRKSGLRILDLGCGTGLNFKYFPNNVEVYGVDFSKDMLKKACEKKIKLRNKNIKLFLMNAESLKFKDNFFDRAILSYSLRLFSHPNKVLNEVSRVLKKNSKIIVIDKFKNKFSFVLNPFTKILGWGIDHDFDDLFKNSNFILLKKIKKKLFLFKNLKQ